MSFMTRWSVARDHAVTADDLGDDGLITDEAVGRWIDRTGAAYLEQCAVLAETRSRAGLDLRIRTTPHAGGTQLGRPPEVAVTATTTEVLPAAFIVAVRVRPIGGDHDTPIDVACEVSLEDPATGEARPLGDEIRDELIALEHAALHYN
jgi:hypothetical protein